MWLTLNSFTIYNFKFQSNPTARATLEEKEICRNNCSRASRVMTTIALSSSLFLVACLLSINILQAQSSALPTSSNAPFAPSKVKSFIQNKCFNPFNPNAGIWSYEGHLVDPTNGRVIANVEGIELVRSLSEIDRSSA